MSFMPPSLGQPAHILLVDDDPMQLELEQFQLSSSTEEYRFSRAQTGEAAVAACAADRPDIILLDIGLPDIDGMEVARRVRAAEQDESAHAHIFILVITAFEDADSRRAAFEAGADDVLVKPFDGFELQKKVEAFLLSQALLRHFLSSEPG